MRILLTLICVLALPGCAMTETGYAPRNFYGIDKDIRDLQTDPSLDASLPAYFKSDATDASRNEFIARRLALYDLEYLRFAQNFRLGRAEAETLFDHAILGLSLATTLASGEKTKTSLGAIITALTGSRGSVERNFYADKTSSAMVSQMNAERKAALVPILAGAAKPITQYSMSDALRDLNAYRAAGTVDGALEAFQKAAAEKDKEQSEKLAQYRVGAFQPDNSSARILKWLYPGFASFDDQGDARTPDGTVVPLVQANWDALTAEIDTLGFSGLTVEAFMNAKEFADARAKAIVDLKIP